jgi:excisionase family DNA binding protein
MASPTTEPVSIDRRTYSMREVARLLGTSASTIYAEAKTGRVAGVPVVRVGQRVVVPRAPIDRLLAGGDFASE